MIDLFVPMKTVSEANLSEHWSKKYKRNKLQQWAIHCYLHNQLSGNSRQLTLPLNILVIRRGKRKMDTDNLPVSLKHVTDAIASFFIPGLLPGRADSDNRL